MHSKMRFDQKFVFLPLYVYSDKEDRQVKVLIKLLLIIKLSCAYNRTDSWEVTGFNPSELPEFICNITYSIF